MERKGLQRMTAIILSLLLLAVLLFGILALFVNQVLAFLEEWPRIEGRLDASWVSLQNYLTTLGLTLEQQNVWMSSMAEQSSGGILSVIKGTLSASASTAIFIVLIPVYVFLILFYRAHWVYVLHRLWPDERRERLVEMLRLSVRTYYSFIKGMAFIYLIVGLLNSIGLFILGIPYAFVFGFVASILTFIPYVGIMVGSLLPVAMAWITYDSIWYPVGVVGIFAFVQYLEANVIFPFAVSSRLNVNTLVMLLAIFTGGLLWGVSGMILFVPFVGILKLIADNNPRWQTLAILLGAGDKR